MPPSIETNLSLPKPKPGEIFPEQIKLESFKVIDLGTREGLDMNAFGDALRGVITAEDQNLLEENKKGQRAKFIVAGNRLYIFSQDIDHFKLANRFSLERGQIKCAGFIKPSEKDDGGMVYRFIYYSQGLKVGQLLDVDDSDSYMKEELPKSLGNDHFMYQPEENE